MLDFRSRAQARAPGEPAKWYAAPCFNVRGYLIFLVLAPLSKTLVSEHVAITRSHSMTPTITAFERSPDRGKGLARDMRVRWALEEVGQPYEVRLLSFNQMK